MPDESPPEYLQPYLTAADKHGAGFQSLLWASPRTQRARFVAMTRLYDFAGRRVLDVGAGRGDLLECLLQLRIEPAEYIALEAVEPLAHAIEQRRFANCIVVRGDFVRDPSRLFVGADVIVFSGSLNTLGPPAFYESLRRAWEATGDGLVFNFLCDPSLAAARHLHWYRKRDVEAFCRSLCREVRMLDDYLEGDCTICIRKKED